MEKDYLINTVYKASEGEGILIGSPQIFIRFQGCAIGCLNCDSKETWSFEGDKVTLDEVMEMVYKASKTKDGFEIKRVSITGGDPLHPTYTDAILNLVTRLKGEGYFINIEAAGTRVVDSIFEKLDFISFDYKTPSTGVRANLKIFKKLFDNYSDKTQIKAVIFDQKDFYSYFDLYSMYKDHPKFNQIPWVITPCYEPGEELPLKRFLDVIEWNENFGGPFRVIGQQHKWLHGPDKKEV